MLTEPVFQIIDDEYHISELQPGSKDRLQGLFEQCADYVFIVEGEPVSPAAAQDTFESLPPGKVLADKFIYGVATRSGDLVGVLEAVRHYPDQATWWIGLMMLSPAVRGRGLGRMLADAFSDYVRIRGDMAVMLGVVEENRAAYQFWQNVGFELVRETEPRVFGKKTQKVFVMRRNLTPESA